MNKTKIKHHLRRTFSVFAVIGALFTLPGATADPPPNAQVALGNWVDCEHITVTDYGSYLVVDFEITTTYTGTFDGTWEGIEQDVFYPGGGYVTIHSEGTFTGSVAGRSGTVRITGAAGVRVGGFPGRSSGEFLLDKGTGDLASLRGVGDLRRLSQNAPVPPGCDDSLRGAYNAQIAFGP